MKGRRLNRKQSSRANRDERSEYTQQKAKELDTLLFMQPKNIPADEPVMDNITKILTRAWVRSQRSTYSYKGTHTCSCGAKSTSADHFIGEENSLRTNSLCLHYVQFHRDEIPLDELDKLRALLTLTKD